MIVVVGSGVSGLAAAIAAAQSHAEVMLVTSGGDELDGGNTALAQGGIAAAIGAGDSPARHAADTIAAGAGLSQPAAVNVLTTQGAHEVLTLLAAGFPADRDSGGTPALGLEAAHSLPRIVHAGGDRTGATLHHYLLGTLRTLRAAKRITLVSHTSLVALTVESGVVTGVRLRETAPGLAGPQHQELRADAVVLATGGYAALFPHTTNHANAWGEGIVIAARAGAAVADLEFIQFHPTVLCGEGLPGNLISEAVRGAGAVLRDDAGTRFMLAAHDAAELAPRDVVARTMHRALRTTATSQLWLDATGIEQAHGPGSLARRFPALTTITRSRGFDWTREAIPVAPAAHYTMGGVVSDLDGRSSLPGLFVAGEVASTGIHGANRLASNSLLEGLVFGARAAHTAIAYTASLAGGGRWQLRGTEVRELLSRVEPYRFRRGTATALCDDENETTQQAAAAGLGIERDAAGIRAAAAFAAQQQGALAELVLMIAAAAEARTESRGAHWRSDYPHPDPAWQRRQAFR